MILKYVSIVCFFSKKPISFAIDKKPKTRPAAKGNTINKLCPKFWKDKISSNIINIGEYNPRIIIIIDPEIPGTTNAQEAKKPPNNRYNNKPNLIVEKSTTIFVTTKHKPISKEMDNKAKIIDLGFSWP